MKFLTLEAGTYEEIEAIEICEELQAGELDGWEYRPVKDPFGSWFRVGVWEGDGTWVAYWSKDA